MLAAAQLLLVLAGVGSVQRVQVEDLRDCVSGTRSDLDYVRAKAAAVETYAGSQLTSPAVPARVRASLAQLVTDTVARELPALERSRERCEFATVPTSAVRRAREAWAAYLDAQLAQLRRAASDLAALQESPPSPAAAEAALAQVFPGGLSP